MKEVKVAKHSRPHHAKIKPTVKRGKQTRKSGKGTSLMHVAAKKQSAAQAADSNMAPRYKSTGQPTVNRADAALAELQKGNS